MSPRSIGVVMNGVTGRMGYRQHLVRSVLAINEQGGVALADGSRIMLKPVLVGRNPEKLAKIAADHGIAGWTTDLDAALADDDNLIYFDTQVTQARVKAVLKAVEAGKHIYAEKPIAETFSDALALAEAATAKGVKNGVVQDKLFLPGLLKLKRLIDGGFFGRILSVRGEFGYWVFEGDWQAAQRRRGTTAPKTAAASSWTCSRTGPTCWRTSSAASGRSTRRPSPTCPSGWTSGA